MVTEEWHWQQVKTPRALSGDELLGVEKENRGGSQNVDARWIDLGQPEARNPFPISRRNINFKSVFLTTVFFYPLYLFSVSDLWISAIGLEEY